MRDGLDLEVQNLHVAGDYTIAELHATATTAEGVPFDNRYCWVCRFDGDLIVEVRAYLDSAIVALSALYLLCGCDLLFLGGAAGNRNRCSTRQFGS
jgi:hypothetical protein